MDSKQLMMMINGGLFAIFETLYRVTQNQPYHTIAMTMLCTTIVFAVYSLAECIAFFVEKKEKVQEY